MALHQPSKDSAIISFVLGLLSVIPWLNIGISLLAMYFGFRSIYNIRKYPDKYAGIGYAVAGTVLGIAWFIGGLFFLYMRYVAT
jgi:ABC-type Fe3+ transport system permease subunit